MRDKLRCSHKGSTVSFRSSVTIVSTADDTPVLLGGDAVAELPDGSMEFPGWGTFPVARSRYSVSGVAATVEFADRGEGRCAIRLQVTNTGGQPVRLRRLTPVSVVPGSLCLGEAPVSDWTYFRQPRKKNDMPAAIRLGDTRPGVMDAVRGTPETGGTPPGGWDGEAPDRFISSEATVLNGGDSALLLGVFPADRQLVTCELRVSPGRDRVMKLDVHCECDDQELIPGASIVSQWVLIDLTCSPLEALTSYAQMLAEHYHDPNADRPGDRPPTVWCSWYYYGDGFTQEEAEETIEWLAEHPLPIDVFQLDECWDLRWGDWYPNADWPQLGETAARLRSLGYEPGIWSCPFLVESRAHTRYHHPHWLLRDAQGEPIMFQMNNMKNCVLDPTHPEVLEFLESMFRRLTNEWGFTYHKLDFTRAVADPGAVFQDPTRNRAEAYRMGLEAVRRGMGPRSYMNVCGGLYGPAFGLANAHRTGSDVRSIWPAAPTGQEEEGYGPFTIKQNTLRFWLNNVAHNDPDALMVRRRPTAYRDERLSLGLMSDEEALTSALNQYLGGGIVCFTERLAEIGEDRLLLLRHCAPSIGASALPLDAVDGVRFPSVFLTHVKPRCAALGKWITLAFVNWRDEPHASRISVADVLAYWGSPLLTGADGLLVTSFRHGVTRRLSPGAWIETESIPAHGCEVLKVQVARAGMPCLLHADGHFSMGGTEVVGWEPTSSGVKLVIDWPWPCPLRLTVGRDTGDGVLQKCVGVPGSRGRHSVSVCLEDEA